MDLATLLPLAIRTSVFLTVFTLGLDATPDDATFLLRRPRRLARSLLAMNVVMPLVAASEAGALALTPAVKIALVALAVSPVPPVLPRKQLGAGGRSSYVIGLLVAAAVTSIVFVPAAIALLGRAFGVPAYVPVGTVAKIVAVTVLLPLALGILVRRVAPALAVRLQRPAAVVAGALLVAAAVPILLTTWRAAMTLVGNGTLAALLIVAVVGIVAGHVLGGPAKEDRVVLALATATRHPGVALAVAAAAFPQQRLVLPAIAWSLLVSLVVSALYLTWYRGRYPEVSLDATASPSPPRETSDERARRRA